VEQTVATRKKKQPGAKAGAYRALAPDELKRIDAYWRAANYLSVGQIYLLDNPLLRKLIDHRNYIREHGEDMPEIRDWSCSKRNRASGRRTTSTESDHG
jgi:phosphoketolase